MNLRNRYLQERIIYFSGEKVDSMNSCLKEIEAFKVAVAHGFNPEGGTKNYVFSTHDTHSELRDAIKISKGYRKDTFM